MFSKEVDGMLKGNYLEIIKLLADFNPEKFKKDVNSISEIGNSFFSSLYIGGYSKENISEILDLCESFGYSLKSELIPYKKNNEMLNKNEPKLIPEYVAIMNATRSTYGTTDSEAFAYLTERMGKDYLLELEKNGWPILECAYRKKLIKTIGVLNDFGLSYEKNPNNVDLLQIAEGDQRAVDMYWRERNKRLNNKDEEFMTKEEFYHFIKIFKSSIQRIDKKKDYGTEKIIESILNKVDVLSKEQREQILVSSIACPDLSLYKSIIKMLKLKSDDEKIKKLIVTELDSVKNHELLYPFMAKEENFLMRSEKTGVYAFQKLIPVMMNLNIKFELKNIYRNNKEAMMSRASFGRVMGLIEKPGFIFKNIEEDKNLFEKIAETNFGLMHYIEVLNISPKTHKNYFNNLTLTDWDSYKSSNTDLNSDQRKEIRYILDQTWLKKDSEGVSVVDKTFKKNNTKVNISFFWAFDVRFFQDSSEKCIFSTSEREKLISNLINEKGSFRDRFQDISSWTKVDGVKNEYDGEVKLIKALYNNLKEDPNTNWKNIVLSEDVERSLKNTEFMFELNARKLSQSLGSSLKNEDVKIIKKVKL
jgi:hypothetical protein